MKATNFKKVPHVRVNWEEVRNRRRVLDKGNTTRAMCRWANYDPVTAAVSNYVMDVFHPSRINVNTYRNVIVKKYMRKYHDNTKRAGD